MKNINKLLTEQFKIGFEFEFYVKNSCISNHFKSEQDQKIKKIPKEVLKEYGHLFVPKTRDERFDYETAGKYFKAKLQEAHPQENWKKAFSVTDDGSLNDTNTLTGVEVVYNHQDGPTAVRHLKQILTLLQRDDFATKSECGLHINISFKDNTKNTKDFSFELIKTLDIAPIKEKFGRKNNDYCVDNRATELDLSDILEDTFSSSRLSTLLVGRKRETVTNVLTGIENLKKPANFQNFVAMIESSVKEYCLNSWEEERPAIAPKNSSSGNYLEFRATGGKNYQHKEEDIIDTLNEYLKAMASTSKSLTAKKQNMKI